MALNARLLAKMRRDGANDDIGAYETGAATGEAVDVTAARAKVAAAEVGVRLDSLARFLLWSEAKVAGGIVVQQEGRGEVALPAAEIR